MRHRKLPESVIRALPPGQRARARGYQDVEDALAAQIRAAGLPTPEREHVVAPPRKWRFDFAWPESGKIAAEVQGGTYSRGRHTRGEALEEEALKLSTAAVLGWRVLFLTTKMVQGGEGLRLISAALGVTAASGAANPSARRSARKEAISKTKT